MHFVYWTIWMTYHSFFAINRCYFCFKMTDDSKIVLRWEIDDAQAKFATGRVESKVFDQGGFKW